MVQKYQSILSKYFYFILAFVLFQTNSKAQSLLNQNYLSNDIEKLIHSNPEQALKIAQHLLSKTNITNCEKAKINFFIAKAYSIKGDYSSALNFLYEEKNYSDYLSKKEKIIIEIEKISLLRELSLDQQAKKILRELKGTISILSDKELLNYFQAKVAIEESQFLLKEDHINKGLDLLLRKKVLLGIKNKNIQDVKLYFNLVLAHFYLEKKDLVKAKDIYDALITDSGKQKEPNIFVIVQSQIGLADICFLKKEHPEAIKFLEEALLNSQKLTNVFLEEKIMRLQNVNYLALNDTSNYKISNANFSKIHVQTEGHDQEAINTAFNLISDDYNQKYLDKKNYYLTIVYIILGLFLIVIIACSAYTLIILQRKKNLNEIINYINITRSNLVNNFLEKKQEPKKNIILKETEDIILRKLKKFENSKRFINKDISLAVLAGQLDSNTKYLSEIINTHYQVNFNMYINKLRINYIIEKLKDDPNFINYKISYLAENCGFSSHSSFATVFKSITGISPVKFIELLNNEKENTLLK
jgi:AraC-like DNA-binding protein